MSIEYPVTVGTVYSVRFPKGVSEVTCTEPNRAGFKGTKPDGNPVTVRSYKLVKGLEDYECPGKPPAIVPVVGREYTVTSGRGVKQVICSAVFSDSWNDTTDTTRPFARIVCEGVGEKVKKLSDEVEQDPGINTTCIEVTEQPSQPVKPAKRRKAFGKREIEFVRDGKSYVIKWNEESSYQLLSADGTELFRCNYPGQLFNTIEEL